MVEPALRPAGRLPVTDRLAPGWLVVQVLGTVAMVGTLATAHPAEPWLWAVYGASLAGWLLWLVLDARRPRFALAMLVLASALPAAVAGADTDGTAVIMTCVVLGRLALLTRPSAPTIIAVGGLDLALTVASHLLWQRSAGLTLGIAALLLVVVLFGLHPRQYRIQADQAELLLHQTHLAQQEQARAAALDERARIAREIHDVLAHSLGALGVQLEVAEALLADKNDVPRALERLRRARRLAAEGMVEARDAVAALRSDVPSLTDALAQLAQDYRRDHHMRVEFRTEGAPRPVSSAAAVSLQRTAREALTNAARHAPGAAVAVTLDFGADVVRLRVSNGTPESAVDSAAAGRVGGYGLTGMRERIALVGGTLRAGPDRAAGWQVTAEVPQ